MAKESLANHKPFSFSIQNSLHSAAFPLIILTLPRSSLLNTTNVYTPTFQYLYKLYWPSSKCPHTYTTSSQVYKLNCWMTVCLGLHPKLLLPPFNETWYSEGAYLDKRFQPVHQQKELVRAMLLQLSRTNRLQHPSWMSDVKSRLSYDVAWDKDMA